jgi:hypothetical protein
VSDYPDYYLATEYLARYSATQIALPIGALDFRELIREGRYEHLPGGLLEATGRLMAQGVRIYVYPSIDPQSGERMELATLEIPDSIKSLVAFLLERGSVQPLEGLPDEALTVNSDVVRRWIREGDPRWEKHVLPEVARAIRTGRLFGCEGA